MDVVQIPALMVAHAQKSLNPKDTDVTARLIIRGRTVNDMVNIQLQPVQYVKILTSPQRLFMTKVTVQKPNACPLVSSRKNFKVSKNI